MDEDERTFYAGLQALSDSAFPKKCNNCGRWFESADAFIAESESVASGSGLKKSLDDDDQPVVMLFRNCVCGSTLMDFFADRRRPGSGGALRRAQFNELLLVLQRRGLSAGEAKKELRKVINGEQSVRLRSEGIKFDTGE